MNKIHAALFLVIVLAFQSAAHAADRWIVVTAPAFREAIQPLRRERAAQGFDVTVIATDEIQHDGSKLRDQLIKIIPTAPEKTYVLLVGVMRSKNPQDALATELPMLSGTIGRMKNLPTDNGYGCLTADLMPGVAVGRLPARSAAEAGKMVEKILTYEKEGRTQSWRRSISILVGNPGGDTPAQQTLANNYINGAIKAAMGKFDPGWDIKAVCHVPQSPSYVADAKLRDASLSLISRGQAFLCYLGHSSDSGFWSNNVPFITRDDLATMEIPHGPGVFVTCGCFACQLDPQGRDDHEGYGLAAIRNPGGPAAVIGATAESYSLAGKLAFDGMIADFAKPKLPPRLGDVFLDIKSGIAKGPVDPVTFAMLDYGDGSNGRIELDVQRKEHLEMWMLLGDPAMKMPLVSP